MDCHQQPNVCISFCSCVWWNLILSQPPRRRLSSHSLVPTFSPLQFERFGSLRYTHSDCPYPFLMATLHSHPTKGTSTLDEVVTRKPDNAMIWVLWACPGNETRYCDFHFPFDALLTIAQASDACSFRITQAFYNNFNSIQVRNWMARCGCYCASDRGTPLISPHSSEGQAR